MSSGNAVIASGNLATSRRTIMGVLGQCALLKVEEDQARAIFTAAGLPGRALEEPDFPISLEQELIICMALASALPASHSPAVVLFSAMANMGIENLGVLGMAMRHAATAIDALKICLRYPQLTWGHSRMVVSRQENVSLFSFAMERPTMRDATAEQIDSLVEYCLVLDLLSSLCNIQDMVEAGEAPLYITFPFPEPHDWQELRRELPCPVHFSEREASLAYPDALNNRPLPAANPLICRSYVSIAEKLSRMLGEDFSLKERVARWLWAYSPPPKRGEIANLLAMSERSLTRQLRAEGTSYSDLLAQVQEERAKNFLRNPGVSVTEIGYRLGYTEPAAFTRAFTGWTGISPLKWRKKVKPD